MSPRRFAFFVALFAALQAAASAADPPTPPAPKPLKVLLITGGCCHDYDAQKRLLADGLEERAYVEVAVVRQGGGSTNSKIEVYENVDWAKGYDVVIHDECFADVKDKAWVDRILAPHRSGTPGVVLHCAMHCYRTGADDWFQFCGVTSRGHGAQYAFEMLNADPSHPVMSKFGPAWMTPAGELYHIEKVWDTAHALATAKNRESGKAETCVWVNEYGKEKTRVFGTTVGHHNETVGSPEYLDLITRGTLWAAGKLEADYLKPKTPKTVKVDVAKDKPSTASSEEAGKGNLAAKANDGSAATRWCADGPTLPQWWEVDLGSTQQITGVKLDWETSNHVYRYRVEGSDDGENWRTLVDASDNKGADYETDLPADESKQYRYVRVTCVGTQGGWASLKDVNVYGTETKTIDPAAAVDPKSAAKLAEVKLPEGYTATVFAAPPAVKYPVAVAAAPDGTLYVSVDQNGSLDREPHRGAIYRLRDVDGDGKADEVKLFVADVDSPRGLVWDRDRLYLMHPPHLSAFIDHDGDGVSDEEQVLVKNVAFGFKDRPADHTSNGVTLGVDGWLYLAIGDFGFMKAEGTDGRTLQLRGGGVVRVRPDGSGLELYSRGTRNILEVGLDPLLNGFARDNTNDGGGWDVRLHHFTGLEEHGYPSLYKHFADEAVVPLADYGGGSGCGACFIAEPGLPAGDSPALYTADWGRDWIYRHVMTPQGATFAADQKEFIRLPRVTDLDVDANSHIYASSWQGATFTYAGDDVGFVVRVSPKGYESPPLPDFRTADVKALLKEIESPSHRRRLAASRDLLARGLSFAAAQRLMAGVADKGRPLPVRVAALFTLALATPADQTVPLAGIDAAVRPFVIRALAEREGDPRQAPPEPVLNGLKDADPRTRLEAAVAIARLGRKDHAAAVVPLLADADPVVAHTAVKALVRLDAADACLAVLDRGDAPAALRTGALRVLQALPEAAVVDALLSRLKSETDPDRRRGLLAAVCRLYFVEGNWKGDSWGTRPDTTGPLYQPTPWAATPTIAAALTETLKAAPPAEAAYLTEQLNRNRIRLDGNLETFLALAAKDPAAAPAVIGQLARGDKLPAAALPLVERTATAAEGDDAVRAQAVALLSKSDEPTAFDAAMAGLAILGTHDDSPEFKAAWDAFRNPNRLGGRVETLEAATVADGPTAPFAAAALMVVADQKRETAERTAAARAVERGWADPSRQTAMIRAALLAESHSAEPHILTALANADPAVAAAAEQAALVWKLDRTAMPTGPAIKTLPLDAVLADAVAMTDKPDLARGERLYATLACNKCHTVKPNEPPRGPYLPNVARTYNRMQLAESILKPSKSLAQGFVTNVFVLADGRTVVGFVTKDAADAVTLRDANGNEATIPKADIDDRAEQSISVMPEGLLNGVSVADFAALLDYLQSLKGQE